MGILQVNIRITIQ